MEMQLMIKRFDRREIVRFGLMLPALGWASRSRAAGMEPPAGKTILEISGKIRVFNDGAKARFDRDMLEALGMTSFETKTPWYGGPVNFEGVRMTALLDAVGAFGDRALVVALNDYTTEIPVDDFSRFNVLLALKRNGDYMPVRDKGPLFIVYPYDSLADLRSQKYYSRSAWQVASIIIK
jgi:hypothetical protein